MHLGHVLGISADVEVAAAVFFEHRSDERRLARHVVLHVVLGGAIAREGDEEFGDCAVGRPSLQLLAVDVVLRALAAAKEQVGRAQLGACAQPRTCYFNIIMIVITRFSCKRRGTSAGLLLQQWIYMHCPEQGMSAVWPAASPTCSCCVALTGRPRTSKHILRLRSLS